MGNSVILLLLFYNFLGIEVVMRITIIRDQRTSVQVAGELKLLGVNLVHWNNERLSVDLYDSLVSIDSRGSKLSIDMRVGLDVASNDLKVDTVRGLSIRVVMLALWRRVLRGRLLAVRTTLLGLGLVRRLRMIRRLRVWLIVLLGKLSESVWMAIISTAEIESEW